MSTTTKVKGHTERKRFSIPAEDTSVLEWCDKQNSLGHSLRQLIKDSIRENGFTDITCGSVTQLPKRGRPQGSTRSMDSDLNGQDEYDQDGSAIQINQPVQSNGTHMASNQTGQQVQQVPVQQVGQYQPGQKSVNTQDDEDSFVDPCELLN